MQSTNKLITLIISETKREIISGKRKIKTNDDSILRNVSYTDKDIFNLVQQTLYNNKSARLSVISAEEDLVEAISVIKKSLRLEEATPEVAIQNLETLKKLPVTAIMLKKNPEAFETVKRMRKYVGNATIWNYSGDTLKEFNEKAEKIRKLSEEVFNRYKVCFSLYDLHLRT